MDEQSPIPKLLQYLFGETAAAAQRSAAPRLLCWCQAFEDWLDERHRKYQRGACELAERSWRRLLSQQGKLPWELAPADIAAHTAWMRSQGRSSNYISHALGVLANFYAWCAQRQVDPQCPPGFNPAAAVPRPQFRRFDRVELLSQDETGRLLAYLQRDASPLGRREYAFFLARLRLGVPLLSLQKLQWGQIELHGDVAAAGCAWVRWRPGASPAPLPDDVWQAIRLWLSSSGRLPTIHPGDYLFPPLVDSLQRLPIDRPEAWASHRYQTRDHIQDNLKVYGQKVGIPDRKLNSLVLRRTALRLRLQAGDSPAQMHAFLDSQSQPVHTKYNLKHLPPLPPDPPVKSQAVVPVSDLPLPLRKGLPFQPGDHLKHGFFAHSQPSELVQAILDEHVQGLEAELAGLRLIGRGLLEMQQQTNNRQQLANLSDAYTQYASRLDMLIEAEKHLQQAGQSGSQDDLWAEEFLAALDRMAAENGQELSSASLRAGALGCEPEQSLTARQMLEEIASIRLVLRNTLALADEAARSGAIGEYIHLADIYGRGCLRFSAPPAPR